MARRSGRGHEEKEEERRINDTRKAQEQQRRSNVPNSAENYHTMEFTGPPVAIRGGTKSESEEFRTVVLHPPTRLVQQPADSGDIDSYHTVVMPAPVRLASRAVDPDAEAASASDIDSYKTTYFSPPVRVSTKGAAQPARGGEALPPVVNAGSTARPAGQHYSVAVRQQTETSGQTSSLTLVSTKLLVFKALLCSLAILFLLAAIAIRLSNSNKFRETPFIYLLVAAVAGILHGLFQTLLLFSRIALKKPLFNKYSWLAAFLTYIFDQIVMIILVTAAVAAFTYIRVTTEDVQDKQNITISSVLAFIASMLVLANSTISAYMLFSNKA